ncbi:MAG: FecCD family ABC transporter permease [Dissulfurimicrobium sp.]|uniref:FecCD family ABC transporter permease n=1 Tax=Dissulfurimicrobium sp. TaxID=2022436 RepID=UPI00404A40AC
MIQTDRLQSQYRVLKRNKAVSILILALALVFIALISLCSGPFSTGPSRLLHFFYSGSGELGLVMLEMRLPRIATAILVGAALAIGGCVSQAILRNPLASPFTLGISSGAAFGAVLGIVLLGMSSDWAIAASAFLFAIITSFLILEVARLRGSSSETLILSGIAIQFLFSSLSLLIQYLGTMDQVYEIVSWFFGSLSKAGWPEIGIIASLVIPSSFILMRSAWDMDILLTGDEAAKSLGVNVRMLRLKGIAYASLITAAAVCFTGVIAFICLISPHIARMIVGAEHRYCLPASALSGAILVLGADTLGRTIWSPQVIPIGVMTSFLGAPFFFYLLIKKTRSYWSC